VKIDLDQTQACDGELVNVDLIVTPNFMKNHINNVQFTATKPGGGTNFDNPSGQGITLSQRSGDILEWQIDNVRWYSTQADHCNETSDYEIKATYKVGSYGYETGPVTFTADTTIGPCLYGEARVTQYFSGAPEYTSVFNEQTQLWETTVAQGTFVRDVQAMSWWLDLANSQYYDMVRDEEKYHEEKQIENPSHVRWGTCFLAQNVMNTVQANQPYTHAGLTQSLSLAQQAFGNAYEAEVDRSWNYLESKPVYCANESEAKNAVGSSYRCTMPCMYPDCDE